MSSRAVGIVLVLLAAALWSTGGLGIKLVDAGALSLAGWRSLFALPVLVAAIGTRTLVPVARAAVRRRVVWAGAASYVVLLVTFVAATQLTTAANAIFLQYTGPIWVALASWRLLREPVGRWDAVAVVGCVFGMALFAGEELSPEGAAGIALAIVSSFAFAAMPLGMRFELHRARGTADEALALQFPEAVLVLGNALVVATALPWMLTDRPSPEDWPIVAALGVLQIGVPYALYAGGVRRLGALESSLVAMLEPVLNPVWVAMGTGEVPGGWAMLGGAIIIGSVVAQGVGTGWQRRRAGPPGGDRPLVSDADVR